jgi:hypothetical protein
VFIPITHTHTHTHTYTQEDPYAYSDNDDPYADAYSDFDQGDEFYDEEEDQDVEEENFMRKLVSSFNEKIKDRPDRTILLRLSHPKGQCRLSVSADCTIDEIKAVLATNILQITDIIEDVTELRSSVVLRHKKLLRQSASTLLSHVGLEDGARVLVECSRGDVVPPKRNNMAVGTTTTTKSSRKRFVLKGDPIHLRLNHRNGKERVTVGTKNTLREFKTYLLSKLELRCPWDTLKLSKDKGILLNSQDAKLLSDFVSSGGGWISFGTHARNNSDIVLSTFKLKSKDVLYVHVRSFFSLFFPL